MRATILPVTPTPDTPAEVARRVALAVKPSSGTRATPERWRETARAAQIASALLDLSKDELKSVIADDSAALDAVVDELTDHAAFLDDVASLLRRAQARLQIVAGASGSTTRLPSLVGETGCWERTLSSIGGTGISA